MAKAGISRTGDATEHQFRAVTGLDPALDRSLGDASGVLDGMPFHVEVKLAGGGVLNQVRPIRFTPVAAYAPVLALKWWVIPANRLVQIAARRMRGQHTECPFESMALSLKGLDAYEVLETGLLSAVLAAIREDRSREDLRVAMESLREGLRWVTENARLFVFDAGPTANGVDIGLFKECGDG